MPWRGGLYPRPYKFKEKWKSGGVQPQNTSEVGIPTAKSPDFMEESGKKYWYLDESDENRVCIVVFKGKFRKKVLVTSFDIANPTAEQSKMLQDAEELIE